LNSVLRARSRQWLTYTSGGAESPTPTEISLRSGDLTIPCPVPIEGKSWPKVLVVSERVGLSQSTGRLTAAAEPQGLGRRGISVVAEVMGLGRATIRRGLRELSEPDILPPPGRIRRPGGRPNPLTTRIRPWTVGFAGPRCPQYPGDPPSGLVVPHYRFHGAPAGIRQRWDALLKTERNERHPTMNHLLCRRS
jgi:hypothetical protein